ncbi:Hypothetical protein NTJ_07259 [Nesidiocoris tenuis]|uniref:Uncharacterized protein n=1 Tax=Nesidiocoris tenuis TaxID=355587 RepID=A0ABN7AQG9_9HEMI|nr:Hypothetical protein NTJ_07259 [Nesidiocoris tenuis]
MFLAEQEDSGDSSKSKVGQEKVLMRLGAGRERHALQDVTVSVHLIGRSPFPMPTCANISDLLFEGSPDKTTYSSDVCHPHIM